MSDPNKISRVIIRAKSPGEEEYKVLVWRKVKIRKSLDEICHYMELTLPASERGKINKHDKVQVLYYNPLITTEYSRHFVTTVMVDEVTGVANASQKYLSVIGRSPARDIIDSTWSSEGALTDMNLEQIARKIADRFGITVLRMHDTKPETDPIPSFSWGNESPWMKLINEADNQGYIFTSNGEGFLYLWKVASNVRREKFSLTEGQNIREIQSTQNGAEQFYEYVIRGPDSEERQTESSCKNSRILTINLTDPDIQPDVLKRRALTEMLRRRENRVRATVTGWGLSDPQIKALGDTHLKEVIWDVNFLIPVKIPSLGIDDKLLISQVEHTADLSTMTSDITLVNEKAYS